MHEVKQRLRDELARIQPAPDGLDRTLRLVRRRERTRRAGAVAVGLLLLPGLVLGGWLAFRSSPQLTGPPPAATSGPVAGSGGPRLVLAGDQELWVVDVAAGTVRHRTLPQLSPGDPPYRIVRRGDKLVLWSYQTLTLDPGGTAQPGVLVRDSWIFIPSAALDRIWVGILDPTSPETERRLQAVREVAVDGRVTVADVRPPGGRWPVAATTSALVFQSQGSGQIGGQLELWSPRTGKVLRRLPGDYPVASHGDLLAWCRQSCARLQVTNVATGKQVQVRPPAGASGFAPEQGVFSPDGKLLAVPVRAGPTWQLALVDVGAATATRIKGAAVPQDYVFVDWSASGKRSSSPAGGRAAGSCSSTGWAPPARSASRSRLVTSSAWPLLDGMADWPLKPSALDSGRGAAEWKARADRRRSPSCALTGSPGATMPVLPSCVTEPLWDQFAALLPDRVDPHPLGGHRRRITDRIVFDKLVCVLVFGGGYERIADTTCSDRTLRRRDEWTALGVMQQLWHLALAAYDRMIGLELSDLAIDSCITKAPAAAARWPAAARSTAATTAANAP